MLPRVLVTGASGFIGRHCVALLAARGFEVHAITSATPAPGQDAVIWHVADLLAADTPEDVLAAVRPQHLLHLAWIATPGAFWTSPLNEAWEACTARLVSSASRHGVRRIVVAGTCAEYHPDAGVCHEFDSAIAPATLYGQCKDAARRALEAAAASHGFSAAWARVFVPYGPGEDPRRLVASVIGSLLRGEPALCTAGTQRRDFLHVADVAAALVALLESSVQGPVNIGSGDAVPVARVVQIIAERLNAAALVRLGARPTPAGEPDLVVADVTRLRDEVGFAPTLDLSGGLADTIEYWRHVA